MYCIRQAECMVFLAASVHLVPSYGCYRCFMRFTKLCLKVVNAAALKSRAAALSVLERCLLRKAGGTQTARILFMSWRELAERHVLAACARRTEELEDSQSRQRHANRERLSGWFDCARKRRVKIIFQWAFHGWKYRCIFQVSTL